jgi:hypothetical protein
LLLLLDKRIRTGRSETSRLDVVIFGQKLNIALLLTYKLIDIAMWKWYLKNKDAIWITAIGGILGLALYNMLYGVILQSAGIILKLPFGKLLTNILEIFKYRITLSFSVFSLSTSIIISFISIFYLKKIYGNYLRRNNKLKILEATYYTDKKSLNITQELNESIYDNKLKIILSNDIAGDPDVGTRKKSKIIYKINGEKREIELLERDLIDLP